MTGKEEVCLNQLLEEITDFEVVEHLSPSERHDFLYPFGHPCDHARVKRLFLKIVLERIKLKEQKNIAQARPDYCRFG